MPIQFKFIPLPFISVAFILFLFRSLIILVIYNFKKHQIDGAAYFQIDQWDKCGIFKGIFSLGFFFLWDNGYFAVLQCCPHEFRFTTSFVTYKRWPYNFTLELNLEHQRCGIASPCLVVIYLLVPSLKPWDNLLLQFGAISLLTL